MTAGGRSHDRPPAAARTGRPVHHLGSRLARQNGWHVAHFRPALTGRGWRTPVQADGKGFPDLVLVRERVIYAELKSRTGSLEPEQRAWRDWLRATGAEWHLWRPDQRDEITALLAPTIAASIARHPSHGRPA